MQRATEEYAQYMAPVLYNGEHCNLFLGFADDVGEVEGVVPEETKKQEYQLENGDRIIPLYPLEETEEKSQGDRERIYEDQYYMGEEIIIEDIDAGDALPELVEVDREELFYGFLIRDNRQKLFYTELVRLEQEP